MKKCFLNVTTVMSALLAMASFAGCSNDDTILPAGGNGDLKTVELHLDLSGYEAETRATNQAHVTGNLSIDNDNMKVIFYDAAGLITTTKNFTWSANPGATQYPTTFTEIPSNSVSVAVLDVAHTTNANVAGDWFYDTQNNYTRPTLNYYSQTAATNINIYGAGSITKATTGEAGTPWTASVSVAPTVARFEITDVSLGTGLTSFEIIGVFLDDFYMTAAIDGNNRGSFKAGTNDVSKYVPAATGIPGYDTDTDAGVTYDLGTTLVNGASIHPAATNPWSYFAFAKPYNSTYVPETTASGDEAPTFVFKIDNVITAEPSIQDAYNGVFYVTIKKMQYDADPSGTEDWKNVNNIMAGYVYATSAGGFTINLSDLKTEPHVVNKQVAVTVSPIAWQQMGVRPVL
jgi:hypothetical protein